MVTTETAIFLGAGASCSEGAPSQATLFRDFFAESFRGYHGLRAGHPSLNRVKVLRNNLVGFFERFFGFDPRKLHATAQFPTFEEVLGIIDLAMARDETFRGFGGNLSPQQWGVTLRDARRDFVFLIALILDKKLESTNGHHRQLVRNLAERGLLERCHFLSFNYDILIDGALEDLRWKYVTDYGIESLNPENQHDPGNSKFPKIPLLKLHGSLNWLYCTTCRTLLIDSYRKIVPYLVINPSVCRCRNCGSLTVPIIIPPTYFKVMSNIFVQNAWHKAEQKLSSCQTWIFCGYSFPDADVHVKYLLKRVQVSSRVPPRIVVVNWHAGKKSGEAEEEDFRYRRFFGAATKVTYETISFEQFAADPSKIM